MEQAELERLELEKEISQFLAQSFLELDEGERQSLAAQVPAAVTPVPASEPGIDLIDLRLLLPLPQGPLDRTMDAGVGVNAVEVEQFPNQGLPLAG